MYKKPQTQEYLQRVAAASLLTPTSSAIALFVGAFTTDLRATLEKIDKPALIVVAGNESNPWMARYRDMQHRIPGARFEIFTDAGHALFVDEAERFNLLLEDFLKTPAASPRSQR
jgi:microsomal epoxide hydrolase